MSLTSAQRQVRKAYLAGLAKKQDTPVLIPALLGTYSGGSAVVQVPDRPDYVYARLRGVQSELVEAYNNSVLRSFNLPVLLTREGGHWRVYDVNEAGMSTGSSGQAFLPNHGAQHSFSGGTGSAAGDITWVFKRQFMPLLTRPTYPSTMGVYVESDYFAQNGVFTWFAGTGTPQFTPLVPATANQALFVTVYLDHDGNLDYITGTPFAYTGSVSDPDGLVPMPSIGSGIPLSSVFIYNGQTKIGWPDIWDVRAVVQDPVAGASSSAWNLTGNVGTVAGTNFVGTKDAVDFVVKTNNTEVARFYSGGGFSVTSLTPSTVVYADASKKLVSLANAAGVLTNDGAGGLSWAAGGGAHNLLSATHTDTTPASPPGVGSLIVGGAISGTWEELPYGGGANSFLQGDLMSGLYWSTFYISGTLGGSTMLDVAAGENLTLTATGSYNIAFPNSMNFPADAVGYLHSDGAGTMTWAAGTGGAALTATYVGFGDAGNLLTGSANLTWDSTRLMAQIADAGTTTVVYPSRLSHITSGTAEIGFGAGLEFQLEDDAGTAEIAGSLAVVWHTATHATELSQLIFRTKYGPNSLISGVITAIDYASVDGNARGKGSVEFQSYRDTATQVASGDYSTLIGGSSNIASGTTSVVVGGLSNTASGAYSVIVGSGASGINVASGIGSVIVGGSHNTASGNQSTAIGSFCVPAAVYSMALGQRSKVGAAHDAAFLYSSVTTADFNSIVAGEFAICVPGGFRVAFDDGSYATMKVADTTGIATFACVGSTPGFVFTPAVTFSAAINGLTLTTTAASTLAMAISAGKTLTITATDNSGITFTGASVLTIPATGTAALLGTANVFTANQTISNAAPSLIMTDTTASAKGLTIAVDVNVANFCESAGVVGSLLVLDLVNNRMGLGMTPLYQFHAQGTGTAGTGVFGFDRYTNNAVIRMRRANNTPASPTASAANDVLGSLAGCGYYVDGTPAFGGDMAAIRFYAAENTTSTAQGTYIGFFTSAIGAASLVERVRITDIGNMKIAGVAIRATTEGTNHLDIFNGTAPVGTLANGCSIYSASGELWTMDAAGNATQQTPHNERGEWIFLSKNTVTGQIIKIDMERMMKALNIEFGWNYVHEYVEASL